MNYEISTDSAPGGEVSLLGNVSGILDFFFLYFLYRHLPSFGLR